MYVPRNMQIEDLASCYALMDNYAFAILVSPDLQISHLPLYVARHEGLYGVIYGHMAKANPQWKVLDNAQVKVVFNGPHSYISPGWYASGPAVPTWNYAAVHVSGQASVLSQEQTLSTIHTLVSRYEPELLSNQHLMPDDYQHKLMNALVGFKIDIQHIEGKHKLGQHRNIADQQGTVAGLARSEHPDAAALLAYMQQVGLGTGR